MAFQLVVTHTFRPIAFDLIPLVCVLFPLPVLTQVVWVNQCELGSLFKLAKLVAWQQLLNSELEEAPGLDELNDICLFGQLLPCLIHSLLLS